MPNYSLSVASSKAIAPQKTRLKRSGWLKDSGDRNRELFKALALE